LDPIDAKRQAKSTARAEQIAAKALQITFADAAERCGNARSAGWSDRSRARQLQKWKLWVGYVVAVLGDTPIANIDTALVAAVLERDGLWTNKPGTADRVRSCMEVVLDWAKSKKHVKQFPDGDNPARWRGNLENLFAAPSKIKKKRNFVALAYADVPAFMKRLRAMEGVAPRALELTVLTATRSSETRLAEWDEFDLRSGVWTVPAAKTKMRTELKIPLAPRAIQILGSMERVDGNPHVFAGLRTGRPLEENAMLRTLAAMDVKATVHGFRASFRTWAGEMTNFPWDVCEKALGHAVGDDTQRAYDRGEKYAKRARLMSAWASYCETEPREAAEVVPIRAAQDRC
jgi:integrase